METHLMNYQDQSMSKKSYMEEAPCAEIDNSCEKRFYRTELQRLLTFFTYPRNAPCSSILFAKQGFVYIGNGDPTDHTVKCVFCFLVVTQSFEKSSDIEEKHRELNPDCPMVKGLDCDNWMKGNCNGEIRNRLFSRFPPSVKEENALTKIKNELRFEHQACSLSYDNPHEMVAHQHNSQAASCNSNQQHISCNSYFPASAEILTNHARHQNEENLNVSVNTTNEPQRSPVPSDASPVNSEREHSLSSSSVVTSSISHYGANGNNAVTTSQLGSSESSTLQSQSQASSLINGPQENRSELSESGVPASISSSSNSESFLDIPPLQTETQSQTSSENSQRVTLSYETLGIITALPKKPAYSQELTRLQTFEKWPPEHHLKPEDLTRAGFFFTGYGDCARCFFCAGGLRNWDEDDDIWVEHARWFPKCGFMQEWVGQPFIDAVQELKKKQKMISYNDVITKMVKQGLKYSIPKDIKDNLSELEQDSAVKAVIDAGFKREDVMKAAQKLRKEDEELSADLIYEDLFKEKVKRSAEAVNGSECISREHNAERDQETIECLKNENSNLRQLSRCKICMDKEISVVFLPCSHFTSCNDCSFAFKSCPICREDIKGFVRAFLT